MRDNHGNRIMTKIKNKKNCWLPFDGWMLSCKGSNCISDAEEYPEGYNWKWFSDGY